MIFERVRVLRVDRPRAVHERVVAVDRADLGDQRHELGLQLLEDLAHLGRLHARLEVVEEGVVGLVVALEALDVAALQLDRALELGPEELVVVLGSRAFAQTSCASAAAPVISAASSAGTRRAFSQSRRVVRIRLASSES